MAVASASLHKAIIKVWNNSTLDSIFQALYKSGVESSEFSVLNDQEASPEQPFPYCVFEQSPGSVEGRMSGSGSCLYEIRDIPWEFRIHARRISGNSKTPKGLSAYLAEEVMKVFGGHPAVKPTSLSLDSGSHLTTIYQNDYGIRTGDNEYQWNVLYIFRLDVSVTT